MGEEGEEGSYSLHSKRSVLSREANGACRMMWGRVGRPGLGSFLVAT